MDEIVLSEDQKKQVEEQRQNEKREKMAKVIKRLQDVLDEEGCALQAKLNYGPFGIEPTVQIIEKEQVKNEDKTTI